MADERVNSLSDDDLEGVTGGRYITQSLSFVSGVSSCEVSVADPSSLAAGVPEISVEAPLSSDADSAGLPTNFSIRKKVPENPVLT